LRYLELKKEKEQLRHELFSDYDPFKLQLSKMQMRNEGNAKMCGRGVAWRGSQLFLEV